MTAVVETTATIIPFHNETTDIDPSKRILLVTHKSPDTDAMLCMWFADRFLAPETGLDADFRYVLSGDRLSEEEGMGYNVIHANTGGGRFDQHGKGLARSSSFQLLVGGFGYDDAEELKPLIELSIATDNVEEQDPCSVHYVFKTLRGVLKLPGSREPDWDAIRYYAFTTFDALHAFHKKKAENAAKFDAGSIESLPGGVTFANLQFSPGLRDAAFEAGADVVLFFNKAGKDLFYIGIQSKEKRKIKLGDVAAALRLAEAKARNIEVSNVELTRFGNPEKLPWFLHDSNALILAGSNSHPLREGEHTKLGKRKIADIIRQTLGVAEKKK